MTIQKHYLIVGLWLLLTAFCGTLATFAGLYLYLSPKLPAVETLRHVKMQTPLRIYSSDLKLLGEFGEKRRTPLTFEQIPDIYIQAILAAEDADFYSHHGISVKGILRALSQNLLSGEIQGGASTITQQVARNFFLSFEQTYSRKLKEALLAIQIENELSKKEILELYANQIFLGKRAYGIQAAAQVYYGKNIDELNLAQIAMIAAIPKGPSTLNPIANPPRALIRRDWILGRMKDLEFIDEKTYQSAIEEPISAIYHGQALDLYAPYIAEMARQKVFDLYGEAAYTEGYRVITTVDSKLQQAAQEAVVEGLLAYDGRHGYRGPERQLSPSYLENDSTSGGLEPMDNNLERTDNNQEPQTVVLSADGKKRLDLQPWIEELESTPVFGGLIPAVVAQVEEQQARVLIPSGEIITLGWEQGLSTARMYRSENARSAKPKTAAEVVQVGDLIRLRDVEGQWHFSQVPKAQGTLVALAPQNGGILSLVGGFDFSQSNYNRATQAKRQPGSNFKPFVYAAALEHGFTPATVVNDAPIVFKDATLEATWRPENSSGKFYGPTRLRKALYMSRNVVSIRVLRSMGVSKAIESLSRYGFNKDELPRDLSLSLGSYGLTPLEVASGYAVLANGGYKVNPYLVEQITHVDGDVTYMAEPATVCAECEEEDRAEEQHKGEQLTEQEAGQNETKSIALDQAELLDDVITLGADEQRLLQEMEEEIGQDKIETQELNIAPRVIEKRVAFQIHSMLQDVIRRGTGIKARQALGRTDLAGKTGTSNGPRDAWFSGYSKDIIATAWVGFDQNLLMGKREFGGTAALPIWIDFMQQALGENTREQIQTQPEGLITVRINPETGQRARAGDPDSIFEIFREENAPGPVEDDDAPTLFEDDSSEALEEELF